MAGVVFENVSKSYAGTDRPAVDGFNLEVGDGEFLVLVGPSGCGKSTTLRMVAGLELPTAGRISIGGRDVTYLPPKDRDIAMVFQNYALYPHMTVKENLSFALKLRRVPKKEIERRVESAAAALGLSPYLKRLPKALSGGQRQRVALGRAIVREPAVFLFDEPLSNLDAKMRVEMRAEIIRLHNRLGATMIYVTHDQTEAMTMGERIVVMSDGRIQQVAPPMELYERPANRFVAGFIGTPPMNLFPPGTISPHRTMGLRPEHLSIHMVGRVAPKPPLVGRVAPNAPSVDAPPVGRLVPKPPLVGRVAPNAPSEERSAPKPPLVGRVAPNAPLEERVAPNAPLASEGDLPAVVDFTEPLGSETLVHVVTGPMKFRAVVRVQGFSPLRPGAPVALSYDPAKAIDFGR